MQVLVLGPSRPCLWWLKHFIGLSICNFLDNSSNTVGAILPLHQHCAGSQLCMYISTDPRTLVNISTAPLGYQLNTVVTTEHHHSPCNAS